MSSPSPTLMLFAGNMGGPGNIGGPVASAYFNNPTGVASDSAGNFYVADSGNNTIRKITPDGMVSTLAGTAGITGSADGAGGGVSFDSPIVLAADSAGNVFVADSRNNTIRKISPTGVVITLAGTPGVSGSADGFGAAAGFNGPEGVATDSAGNIYVADSSNNTIRKITPAGAVSTLAGTPGITGSADVIGTAASFNFPTGIATDSAGNVYVADTSNYSIRKITPSGVVTTLAGTPGVGGSGDGIGAAAIFYYPTGVAADSSGNVYVADAYSNANRQYNSIRKITPSGVVTTLAVMPGVYQNAYGQPPITINPPTGIAIDSAGNVYVADASDNAIRRITPTGVVTTHAGQPAINGSADGSGSAASFNNPFGIATDGAGNVYVTDSMNFTVREITPSAVVSTLAGTVGIQGSADGSGAAARFSSPRGIATDSTGNVYVGDAGGYIRPVFLGSTIRKVTPSGEVSTLAGTSAGVNGGSVDGIGAAARFNVPNGVATDSTGNIYVADTSNNTIRKIMPTGAVNTLAGTPGVSGSGDGIGAAASFNSPEDVATDSAGNIYVTDSSNNTIRKITSAGVVSTLAGTPGITGSADGNGTAASFNFPTGIATDGSGNVYVADTGNNTIRKITPFGMVATVVGVPGESGFLPGALPGVLSAPRGVAISGTTLYITLYNGVAVVNNLP